ncbi:MAG TPA: histidine phosphatase family protein [Eubacteriaceae bacterium]|jgi:broad specificity phosphatase PhoE|nr:histidine phosphatase family protein [Eubacteriaceae bacterium]
MTRLFIIRHGETLWNREKRAQGIQNIALTENGKLQGKYLAERLAKEKIDYIYSSDLSRAYKTAKIIGDNINKPVLILPELREMDFGLWEGLTIDDIKLKFRDHYNSWENSPHTVQIPQAETLIQVQERAMKSIMNIINKHKNKNIVLVSHGVTIKTIILGLLDIDLSNYRKIRQDNTAVNIIDYREDHWVLTQLNDTCHLANIK